MREPESSAGFVAQNAYAQCVHDCCASVLLVALVHISAARLPFALFLHVDQPSVDQLLDSGHNNVAARVAHVVRWWPLMYHERGAELNEITRLRVER